MLGVREILEKLFDGEEQRSEYTIVKGGVWQELVNILTQRVVLYLGQKKRRI